MFPGNISSGALAHNVTFCLRDIVIARKMKRQTSSPEDNDKGGPAPISQPSGYASGGESLSVVNWGAQLRKRGSAVSSQGSSVLPHHSSGLQPLTSIDRRGSHLAADALSRGSHLASGALGREDTAPPTALPMSDAPKPVAGDSEEARQAETANLMSLIDSETADHGGGWRAKKERASKRRPSRVQRASGGSSVADGSFHGSAGGVSRLPSESGAEGITQEGDREMGSAGHRAFPVARVLSKVGEGGGEGEGEGEADIERADGAGAGARGGGMSLGEITVEELNGKGYEDWDAGEKSGDAPGNPT